MLHLRNIVKWRIALGYIMVGKKCWGSLTSAAFMWLTTSSWKISYPVASVVPSYAGIPHCPAFSILWDSASGPLFLFLHLGIGVPWGVVFGIFYLHFYTVSCTFQPMNSITIFIQLLLNFCLQLCYSSWVLDQSIQHLWDSSTQGTSNTTYSKILYLSFSLTATIVLSDVCFYMGATIIPLIVQTRVLRENQCNSSVPEISHSRDKVMVMLCPIYLGKLLLFP